MYTQEDVRNIILNSHKIKEHNKCVDCSCTGYQNWDENGNDIKPGPADKSRTTGTCETCDGIGFVDVLIYED